MRTFLIKAAHSTGNTCCAFHNGTRNIRALSIQSPLISDVVSEGGSVHIIIIIIIIIRFKLIPHCEDTPGQLRLCAHVHILFLKQSFFWAFLPPYMWTSLCPLCLAGFWLANVTSRRGYIHTCCFGVCWQPVFMFSQGQRCIDMFLYTTYTIYSTTSAFSSQLKI